MLDNFREWLSDNLRYILLGLAILAVLLLLFFGIKAITGNSSDKKENEPEQYEEISADNFMEYSKSMFSYWTENDFASSFRKMLTLEQFRNEEMQALYQQYLVSGPAEYVKDMFESIGVVEADKKATMFYSIMFFYYSLYDGAKDKKRIKEQFEKSISNII